jgi:hypothetical protein
VKDKIVDVEVLLYRALDKRGKAALDDAVSQLADFLRRAPRLQVGML